MAVGRAGTAGLLALVLTLAGAALSPQSPRSPDLRPTVHPTIPTAPEHWWLAPIDAEQAAATADTYASLQEGVRRCLEGDFEGALPLLEDAAWAKTPLAAHAAYYAARARLGLEQYAEAQQRFRAVLDARPSGFLTEGATLGLAEASEALDQPEVALALHEAAAERSPLEPEKVWLKVGQLAAALGDRRKAADALLRVYYDYPLSEQAAQAATELKPLRDEAGGPGTRLTFSRDLDRAERLYRAARWADARSAFLDLRPLASGDDRALVDVRLAGAEVSQRRFRQARDRVLPYVSRATPHQAEARFIHARATRGLGRHREFVTLVGDLVKTLPESPWSEAALDALGTHYILVNQDEQAAGVFADLVARFPSGRYTERAAWKAGWWAWRRGDWAATVRFFEGGAERFPRSDHRPAWLYWSGRARERLGETAQARARLMLAVADYGQSYYGRLAAAALGRLPDGDPAPAPGLVRPPDAPPAPVALPPTEALVRTLIAAELYDAAANEIEYARRQWGSSTLLDASRGLVLNRQGDLRHAINGLKRAYPQYLTADGDKLPDAIQKVIYPVDYWPLVQKFAADRGLDPYLLAALIAQESTFDASARSSANAYGLMQIVPATGRRVGRTLGLRRVTVSSLTDAETNLHLGTTHFVSLLKQFGEVHLALAAYNAGEQRVNRWIKEKPGLPADEFIDDIPFPETQGYVRRILGTAVDYRRLYGSEK